MVAAAAPIPAAAGPWCRPGAGLLSLLRRQVRHDGEGGGTRLLAEAVTASRRGRAS